MKGIYWALLLLLACSLARAADPIQPADPALPECMDSYGVYSHFTLVGFPWSGLVEKRFLAVRELYDSSEPGDSVGAVDCGYPGLASLWEDVTRRGRAVCRLGDQVMKGTDKTGGVRLHFIPLGNVSARVGGWPTPKDKPQSPDHPVFTVYESVLQKDKCTPQETAKKNLEKAREFAKANALSLDGGFKPVALGNRLLGPRDCLPGRKRSDCTQVLTVKLKDRTLAFTLEMTSLLPLNEVLDPANEAQLNRDISQGFEVAVSVALPGKQGFRLQTETFYEPEGAAPWSILGPCELFANDTGIVILKLSILVGYLGMTWEEARFLVVFGS